MSVMFEFKEVKSETEYKPLELKPDASFTQTWLFGQWQEAMGRKVRRFEIRDDSETLGFFQIIKYSLPFYQSFLYIPHAPVLRSFSEERGRLFLDFLEEFYKKLVKIAKEENTIFVRFDVSPPTSNELLEKYFKKTPISHYHSSYFQPKYEWILNLEKPEEELLNNMHPKTRYNIGLAERKEIKIEIVSENFGGYFDDFYKLLEETAKRDNFSLHLKIYYENIFKTLNSNSAFLIVAKYGDKILAINLILLFGETAYFLFGGSSDEHKNLMFSHLAQWEAVKEAKRRGFKVYNFGGVDVDGIYETFGGISIFKKRFGGKFLEYSDSYDLVLKPFWYFLYNLRKLLMKF